MADKWIQLMSEDGTDNLFPTSKMDLLWENVSTSSAFTAQTVSLDLSSYSYIGIILIEDKDYRYVKQIQLLPIGLATPDSARQYRLSCSDDGSTNNTRRIVAITSSGIQFGAGQRNSNDNNNVGVPWKIYGIK